MAQFQYNAVNQAGKRLSGLISAETEEEARKQLNELGISVLSIEKLKDSSPESVTAAPAPSKDLPRFEFEAKDPHGRQIVGTIPAETRQKAYQRLLEEYNFLVTLLVPEGATDVEKERAREEDLSQLLQQKTMSPVEGAPVDPAFEAKRKALLERVDFILSKIKTLLQNFEAEIRPDRKKEIQNMIDKLLRIKSSTNLDYIAHSSEELLQKIQDQELFLNKERMERERQKVKLASQALLAELHSVPEGDRSVSDDIETLHTKWSQSHSRLIRGLGHFLEKYLPSPAEKELKQRIKTLEHQIWSYRRIWLTAPKESKEDAKMVLDMTIKQKNQLEAELKALKRDRKALYQQKREEGLHEPLITEEITQLVGFLLTFYLVIYFASYYQITKGFAESLPFFEGEVLLGSPWVKYFLLSLFLWYGMLSFRLMYLRYKSWANLVLVPIGILANATLLFNV